MMVPALIVRRLCPNLVCPTPARQATWAARRGEEDSARFGLALPVGKEQLPTGIEKLPGQTLKI
jgi:hypothetical protein